MRMYLSRKPENERVTGKFNSVLLIFHIESIEEMRLFFHLSNDPHLRESLFGEKAIYSTSGRYLKDEFVANDISTSPYDHSIFQPYRIIKKEILEQGFNI